MNPDLPPTLPCPYPERPGQNPKRHKAELMADTAPGVEPFYRCNTHGWVYGPVKIEEGARS